MPMTEDGVRYEDGKLKLRDGRTLAWRWWGEPGGIPVLRLQGTPGCRLSRLPGRGVGVIAEDLAALLDHHKLDRVPVMGTSGGGPHALAVAANHPKRITAVTGSVGSSPLEPDEVSKLVGVNAAGYAAAERGWEPLHELLAQVRVRLLGDEGMAGVLSDAPPEDRAIMQNPTWQKISREGMAEALKQGAEGWADESMALHHGWDFDPEEIHTTSHGGPA